MKVYKKRCGTVILNNQCSEFNILLNEMQNKYNQICQDIFNITKNLIYSKQINKRFFGSFCDFDVIPGTKFYMDMINDIVEKERVNNKTGIVTKHYTITTAKLVKTIFKDVFIKHGFQENLISNYKRSIVKHTLDRIDGQLERNEKKDKKKKNYDPNKIKLPKINFHGNALHIAEGVIFDKEKNTLSFPMSIGKITIPIHEIYSKGEIKKNCGGNFVLRKTKNGYPCITFHAGVDIITDVAYYPTGFIGFDINQSEKDWITFDNGEKIARPQEMTDVMKENTVLNNEISNDDKRKIITLQDGTQTRLISKQRRKRRLKQQLVLNKAHKMTRKFALQVINKAISSQMGIAIDKIAPGATGVGEFGQHVSKVIQELCEDMSIPFYVCPSPYTSQMCSQCKYQDKKNRKKDDFTCLSCGYKIESHINAANNIRDIAEKLYIHRVMFNGLQARNVESLIVMANELEEFLTRDVDKAELV